MIKLKKLRLKSTGEVMYQHFYNDGYYGVNSDPKSKYNIVWVLREEFEYVIDVLCRDEVEREFFVDYNKYTSNIARGKDGCYMFLKGKRFPGGSYSAWVNMKDLDKYRIE